MNRLNAQYSWQHVQCYRHCAGCSCHVAQDPFWTFQRGKIHFFNECLKGSDKHWLGCTSLEVWLLSWQTSEMAQPSRCLFTTFFGLVAEKLRIRLGGFMLTFYPFPKTSSRIEWPNENKLYSEWEQMEQSRKEKINRTQHDSLW